MSAVTITKNRKFGKKSLPLKLLVQIAQNYGEMVRFQNYIRQAHPPNMAAIANYIIFHILVAFLFWGQLWAKWVITASSFIFLQVFIKSGHMAVPILDFFSTQKQTFWKGPFNVHCSQDCLLLAQWFQISIHQICLVMSVVVNSDQHKNK